MRDKEFLFWLAARLIYMYGEDQDVDFVNKLRSIAEHTPLDHTTPNSYDRLFHELYDKPQEPTELIYDDTFEQFLQNQA